MISSADSNAWMTGGNADTSLGSSQILRTRPAVFGIWLSPSTRTSVAAL